MSKLSTPGIPTRYAGTEFRSRLEARWVAFFDLLRWTWEYEPLDGDGYIPDFVLTGPDPVFVEVKPAVTLDELRDPLAHAVEALGDRHHYDILAVGVGPRMAHDEAFTHSALGLIAQWGEPWEPDPDPVLDKHRPSQDSRGFYGPTEAWFARCVPCKRLAFITTQVGANKRPLRARPCAHEGNFVKGEQLVAHHPDVVRAAWAEATNVVRWMPPS